MGWLDLFDISEVRPEAQRPECDPAETRVMEFLRQTGSFGRCVLRAWDTVDPLHCAMIPDEYLDYAKRFVKETGRYLPEEWRKHPGLVVELVRRSFHPTQTCYHIGLQRPFVRGQDIDAIAQQISRGVKELGGWEKLCQPETVPV